MTLKWTARKLFLKIFFYFILFLLLFFYLFQSKFAVFCLQIYLRKSASQATSNRHFFIYIKLALPATSYSSRIFSPNTTNPTPPTQHHQPNTTNPTPPTQHHQPNTTNQTPPTQHHQLNTINQTPPTTKNRRQQNRFQPSNASSNFHK